MDRAWIASNSAEISALVRLSPRSLTSTHAPQLSHPCASCAIAIIFQKLAHFDSTNGGQMGHSATIMSLSPAHRSIMMRMSASVEHCRQDVWISAGFCISLRPLQHEGSWLCRPCGCRSTRSNLTSDAWPFGENVGGAAPRSQAIMTRSPRSVLPRAMSRCWALEVLHNLCLGGGDPHHTNIGGHDRWRWSIVLPLHVFHPTCDARRVGRHMLGVQLVHSARKMLCTSGIM